ncbi:ZINC FINGER BED DOMAIN-CONTAINING PROTEIN RICESLEEPER 1-LIKE ISOFORM X1 [Salix purpurea]|uniref:ZINC FINGER BED DOMAIN-CONTAINING PROTEIN RICESLEEPER 1-LIKE ISOFORM X1 n=1 Tax=Salix purpurea TaxID=77065 RepID=A0A9Q1A3I3_SALPP|nr:ZINC FINGER BED DOMAIN-CONTAINING PROTEIN RICESLEEPER 1-LIKE ISOFORM X1 [Salix purpurea]
MLDAKGVDFKKRRVKESPPATLYQEGKHLDSIDQILLLSMAFLPLQRLMECAKAIEGGNLDVADSLLQSIPSIAYENRKSTRKVVEYFAEALVRRVYGIRPLCPSRSLTFLFEPFDDLCKPFFEFAQTTTEDAIADALNPGNKRLHIIDLSILSGTLRWIIFIRRLKLRYGGLQSVLITSVTPKRSSEECDGRVPDVDLEWRQLKYNSPDDIVKCFSKLRRKRKDEMVVVNWGFILGKLLAQDGAIEQVLSKVKDLEADIMVISEQEANFNSPDLSERLEQSIVYYSAVFELLEQEDYINISRQTSYFRRQIGNVVACEGIDRVERIEPFDQWQHRLSQAGFCQVPLQEVISDWDFFFTVEEHRIELKDGHVQLSWRGFPLAVGSVWKLTDPPQSSSGLCKMQDRVDDSEEMARSSESEDDEENDPCIMADRYLWCTQDSSMNRIAASAKLFDILEYICHLYELPAAGTWISYNKEGDTNSNEKRLLRIDYSACYTLTLSIDEYIDGYAHYTVEEGQGVVGKALQSNFHIQHDVYEPDPAGFSDYNIKSKWWKRSLCASFAIRLTSTHSCKDDYILKFFLPKDMEDTSERERLISKVLCTLQKNCLESWKFWAMEQNEASGSGVRLDDERMSTIPQEAVSSILQLPSSDGGNEFMTTSNQAGETHEPLEQDIQEQSAIAAPVLNDENVSLNVDGGLQSTNKQIKRSVVWDTFDKHVKNGEKWATCKFCKMNYKAKSKNGTSNLLKHSRKCSRSRQDEAEQNPLILVETSGSSTSVIQRNSVINQETMIINHGYPLDMVQLHSKIDVEDNALAICRQEKEKLVKYFDSLFCFLSLTLELWSSNDKMMTYCCLTVHFIDDGWQLKKKILAFRNLRYNYDMGTVHEVIKSVLAEWRINKNVRFILLDITPPKEHMIGELREHMIGELRSKVCDKTPLLHGHLFCISSYAQILSLLVQDGFSEIRSLLYKIRECIEYVNGSSLGRQMLQMAIRKGSLQDKEMPFQDVPARWDTTFLMLERSLEFREAFNHLEHFDCDFKVNPSAEEWNKATSVCECLKEFHKSTSNFPTTLEGYFLSVRDVYKNLLKWEQSEHVYVRSIANRMKGKFDEYWGEASLALGISVVLNPSFKLDLVEYGYQQIHGIDASFHFSKFRDDVTGIYHKYAKDFGDQGPSSSAMVDESPSSDISFKEWRKGKYERNMVHSQQNELDQYLKQPPLEELDKDGNVLAWWQENAQKFPILGKIARDFLAIPVSTVISKSSEVMKMASVHDGVHPEIAEALICGKDWLDSRSAYLGLMLSKNPAGHKNQM